MEYANTYSDAIGTLSFPRRLRGYARHAFLSVMGSITQPLAAPSLRLFYCHHVFDDERDKFAAVIDHLLGVGDFIDTENVLRVLSGERALSRHAFHISFDDGYKNILDNALPVLYERSVPSIIFVATAVISNPSQFPHLESLYPPGSKKVQHANWCDLERACRKGSVIGSHTRSHIYLSKISSANWRLEDEIMASKQELENRFGSCDYFSWPYGRLKDIDPASISVIKKAGYSASFGAFRGQVRPGATDPFKDSSSSLRATLATEPHPIFRSLRGQVKMVTRIVILTSNRYGVATNCLPELCDSERLLITGIIVAHRATAKPWRLVRRKAKKILRIGIGGALNGIRLRSWYRETATRDIADICTDRNVKFFEVPAINSEKTAQLLLRLRPDLGVSLGNSYIAPGIFEIPKLGMINVHGERLPDYRNAQSVIWPIYYNETKTGLSIHQIDKGIDTGAILYSEQFNILFARRLQDTVRGTLALTRARTPFAVRFVCENYFDLASSAAAQPWGRAFTTPSLIQYARMECNNQRLYHLATASSKTTSSA